MNFFIIGTRIRIRIHYYGKMDPKIRNHVKMRWIRNAVYFVNKASTILCSRQVKVTHTVYNRMGLLLKSLITVARVTPAYKLSRTQGQESYVICYR